MKLKSALAAAALAVVSAGAFAADQTVTLIDLGNNAYGKVYEGSFDQLVSSPGDVLDGGNDTITFAGAVAGLYKVVLDGSAQFVNGLTVTLNGAPVTITPVGSTFTFFSTISTLSPDFTLYMAGTALDGARTQAHVSISAIPEPETYALMLAGLGVMGFIARRRRPNQ